MQQGDGALNREFISCLTLNPAIDRTIIIDDFALEKVNYVKEETVTAGSKGVNVAKMLAVCGVNSLCFGLLGGENGAFIDEQIKKFGVVSDFIEVNYAVRTNLKVVDLKNTTCTDINFEGGAPNSAVIKELLHKASKVSENSRIVVIGGSLPPGVSDDLYCQLLLIGELGLLSTVQSLL